VSRLPVSPSIEVKFELELELSETDGRIIGKLSYAYGAVRPNDDRAPSWLSAAVLQAMVADADQVVDRIEILPAEERALSAGEVDPDRDTVFL